MNTVCRQKAYQTGRRCELWTAWYLRLKGYRILARNFKVGRGTTAGEIDLIVKKGNLVAFVEVKRRSTFRQAIEAITLQNQMRVIRSSGVFLKKNPAYRSCQIRYDAILWQEKTFFPKHILGAWHVL